MTWEPCGVVTLLTDFGLSDPYVGVMKGVLYAVAPELTAVIDVTHGVPPQSVELAGFYLQSSVPYFPEGTVHVVVVDPEVGTQRALLLVETRGQLVVAPDNGVVSALVEDDPEARVRAVDPARAPAIGGSRTFHGRDRIAPLAGRLAAGEAPEYFGDVTDEWRRLESAPARAEADGSLSATVVAVDSFGNLITNVCREQLGDSRSWECVVGPSRIPLVETYAAVEPMEPCSLVDSFDRLEIAVRDGNAARELRLGRGTEVRVERPKR